jgi:lipopolysaccharide transport system permease protein
MRDLTYYRDLIFVLTQKEIKVRYKNTVLGYFWSVTNPLAFAFVFFIAFKVILRIQMEDYALFLIAGLFPWQWFANSISASPAVLLGNASLIKKVNFPRNIIPFAMFMLIYGKTPSLSWIYGIPLLLFIQFLLTYGLCLIVASTNLFFRDIARFTDIFMTLLFYFTPIIYPETMIPKAYSWVYFTPASALMISWRNLFLYGSLDPNALAISFGYSLLSLVIGFLTGSLELNALAISFGYGLVSVVIGYLVFRRLSRRFAEVL